MKNFFKKAAEIYNMAMMVGVSLVLNAIVIGVVFVLPFYILINNVECNF